MKNLYLQTIFALIISSTSFQTFSKYVSNEGLFGNDRIETRINPLDIAWIETKGRISKMNVPPENYVTDSTSVIICESELPYIWYGHTFMNDSILTDTIAGTLGNDTIRTYSLSVVLNTAITESITICENELPFTWYGHTFTNDSILKDTIAGTIGCDTIRTLDVKVANNTPPVKPILPIIYAECDTTPITPYAIDNCNDTIYGTTITNFPIDLQGNTTITWVFTDSTGNYVTATQQVLVEDQTAPQWVSTSIFLNPLHLDACSVSTLPSNTGIPDATDNCGGVEVTYSDVITQTDPNCVDKTITRTWTARDSSNNTTVDVQTIYVTDNTAPVLICRDTLVATADGIWQPWTLEGISYYDECGIDTVFLLDEEFVFADDVAGFCPDSVFRTYVVWDRCGNSSTCTQTITVNDLSACNMCQDTVPIRWADLDDAPDSVWILNEKWLTREGACCLFSDHNTAYGCIAFNVYLDEDAVGLVMDIYSPAPPQGAEYYRIDCSDEQYELGKVVCLSGGQFYTLTFCKPGDDSPWYEIRSIPGAAATDSVICTKSQPQSDINVQGFEASTVEWSVSYPLGADSLMHYLDLSDVENPVFTPDSLAPALIKYQVCGTLVGAPECDGDPIMDCAEVVVMPNALESITSVISDKKLNFDFKVYPNPNSGKFEIEIKGFKNGEVPVQIFNSAGKCVYTKLIRTTGNTLKHSIDLSGQPNGVYHIKCRNDSKILSKSIVLN